MGQDHKSRQKGNSEIAIPEKVYFRIGEVSQLAQTKPYVLRYWETEFPSLRPSKTETGHRLYRRKDVETVFHIKRLLYEQGFTIEGARKQIASLPKPANGKSEQRSLFHSNSEGPGLKLIERELRNILTMLSRKC
ncbi:MAG: MerR family transcriptional regulator [Acidobacteriota bacterium]|nr:MerR family transcriptional regulator [Acidobacteriota bacterium]